VVRYHWTSWLCATIASSCRFRFRGREQLTVEQFSPCRMSARLVHRPVPVSWVDLSGPVFFEISQSLPLATYGRYGARRSHIASFRRRRPRPRLEVPRSEQESRSRTLGCAIGFLGSPAWLSFRESPFVPRTQPSLKFRPVTHIRLQDPFRDVRNHQSRGLAPRRTSPSIAANGSIHVTSTNNLCSGTL